MSLYATIKATFGVILFALVVAFTVGVAGRLYDRFGSSGVEVFFAVIVLGSLWVIIYRAARRIEDSER